MDHPGSIKGRRLWQNKTKWRVDTFFEANEENLFEEKSDKEVGLFWVDIL